MNDQELKEKITSAYEKATPEMLDKIKESCSQVEQLDAVIDFEQKKRSKMSWQRIVAMVASIAVVFVVGFGSGRVLTPSTTVNPENPTNAVAEPKDIATVYLDVNPSLALQIDEEMRVSGFEAEGEDSEAVVGGMDLEGASMEVALNAIVGSLYMNGYITDDSAAILVSVDSNEQKVLEDITTDLNQILENKDVSCDLIMQQISGEGLADIAVENNVSIGKLAFVQRIIVDSATYTEADLSTLCQSSIPDLSKIFKGETAESSDEQVQIHHMGTRVVEESVTGAQGVINNATGAANDIVNNTTNAANGVVNNTTDAANNFVDNTVNAANDIVNNTTKSINGTVNSFFGKR